MRYDVIISEEQRKIYNWKSKTEEQRRKFQHLRQEIHKLEQRKVLLLDEIKRLNEVALRKRELLKIQQIKPVRQARMSATTQKLVAMPLSEIETEGFRAEPEDPSIF